MFLFSLSTFFFFGCVNTTPRYIKNSSGYTSFGIDYHDLEKVAKGNIKSLSTSSFIKSLPKDKKIILAISDINNLTQEEFDVEFLARKLAREVSNIKNIALTNAIAGSGAATDSLIKNARILRENEEYNQYTTQKKGMLLAPEYSLTAKVTEQVKNVGNKKRADYLFLFVLTDIKTGLVIWDHEEVIIKIIEKSQVGAFSNIENLSCEEGSARACYEDGNLAYRVQNLKLAKKLYKKSCSLGSINGCDDLRRLEREEKERKFRQGSVWGIAVGGDVGFGDGNFSMKPVPYTTNTGSGFITLNSDAEFYLVGVYAFKLGLYYKKQNDIYFNIGMIYGGYEVSSSSEYDFSCSGLKYSCSWGDIDIDGIDIDGITFNHKLLGVNLKLGYEAVRDGYTSFIPYFGGGVLMDIGSTIKASPAIASSYEINHIIKGSYPFWEVGMMLGYKSFYVDMNYKHMFDGKIGEDWASIGSLNLGAMLLFDLF
ncbi:MAG: penicillin-binding protein activator LpoB [Helicobacter sp.]|nr:penicillin-binding protein activator LpoB [Helicobacter sp.]